MVESGKPHEPLPTRTILPEARLFDVSPVTIRRAETTAEPGQRRLNCAAPRTPCCSGGLEAQQRSNNGVALSRAKDFIEALL